MLHNFNNINFTSLKIRGGILENVALRIEKKIWEHPCWYTLVRILRLLYFIATFRKKNW